MVVIWHTKRRVLMLNMGKGKVDSVHTIKEVVTRTLTLTLISPVTKGCPLKIRYCSKQESL